MKSPFLGKQLIKLLVLRLRKDRGPAHCKYPDRKRETLLLRWSN
jgi:hypothetical protein